MFKNMFGGGTRRRMMMNCEKKSEWDIEIYADESGFITGKLVVPPEHAVGFVIEVNITKAYNGYVFDIRNATGISERDIDYVAYLALGTYILDYSDVFSKRGCVGKNIAVGVGCNRNGTESTKSSYLLLKWVY